MQWGKPDHENLQIVKIKENGRTYRTIKTCALTSDSSRSSSFLSRALNKLPAGLRRSIQNEEELQTKAALISEIFKENKYEFEKLDSEFAIRLINILERHFNDAKVDCNRYFHEAKYEAMLIQGWNEKMAKEAQVTDQIALMPTNRNSEELMREDKEKRVIEFVCNTRKVVVGQKVLFENLEKKFPFLETIFAHTRENIEIHLEHSFEAVQYFVDFHYEKTAERKLPLPLLVEVEQLADFMEDIELLENCKHAIRQWQTNPYYNALFVDLLSNHYVPPQSEIYEKIPFSKVRYTETILPENDETIWLTRISLAITSPERIC